MKLSVSKPNLLQIYAERQPPDCMLQRMLRGWSLKQFHIRAAQLRYLLPSCRFTWRRPVNQYLREKSCWWPWILAKWWYWYHPILLILMSENPSCENKILDVTHVWLSCKLNVSLLAYSTATRILRKLLNSKVENVISFFCAHFRYFTGQN